MAARSAESKTIWLLFYLAEHLRMTCNFTQYKFRCIFAHCGSVGFKNKNNNTVSSPLTPASLEETSASAGAAARIAETRKHSANDSKCQELGWVCTPLAVESYGNWGMETRSVFKCLASLIANQSCPKASVSAELYGHLNLSLVRSAARAILGREPMRVGG